METIISIAQIVSAALLVTAILIQNRGAGLGSAFGGESTVYTKRGPEKFIFIATIVLAVLFLGLTATNTFFI